VALSLPGAEVLRLVEQHGADVMVLPSPGDTSWC